MKAVSALVVLTVAALASAQSQCLTMASQIPSCGVRCPSPSRSGQFLLILANLPTLKVACLSSAASAVGCAQTDFACQCSSSQSSAIQNAALDCIIKGCGAVTGRQVSSAALALCSCVAPAGSTTFISTTFTTLQYGSNIQDGSVPYFPPRITTTTGTTVTNSPAVSSTITSIPSGLLVETLSGTSYTENGWTTTTNENHQSTVLPIIAEGHGYGVVIWGLPLVPYVDFWFPSLNLPKFYFPCIRLFGISVGNCENLPVTDGPPTDNPPNSHDNSPTSSDTGTTTSSTSSSTSSSSSTQAGIVVTPILDEIYAINTASLESLAEQILASQMTCMTSVSGSSLTGQECDFLPTWWWVIPPTASETSPLAATTTSISPLISPSTSLSTSTSTYATPISDTTPTVTNTPENTPTTNIPEDTPTTTAASPTTSPIVFATQSCHVTNNVIFLSYSIFIGLPFGGNAYCDCGGTFSALDDEAGILLTNWHCVERNGDIQLWFNTPYLGGMGDKINTQLKWCYPLVNSFNCPNE